MHGPGPWSYLACNDWATGGGGGGTTTTTPETQGLKLSGRLTRSVVQSSQSTAGNGSESEAGGAYTAATHAHEGAATVPSARGTTARIGLLLRSSPIPGEM